MLRSSPPRFVLTAFLGLGLGSSAALFACSQSLSSGDGFGGGSGGLVGATIASGYDASNDVLPDTPVPPAALSYKYLCGEGDCVPGGERGCTPDVTSATGTGATGSTGSAGGAGGAGGGSQGSAGEGGGGQGGAGGAGGSGGEGGGSSADYTCRVVFDGAKPESLCVEAGAGELNAPCLNSTQCASGLGCVEVDGQSNVGLCLPYCCGALEACGPDTFCNPRRSIDVPSRRVPVCEPAVECSLLTPGTCTDGEICTVVRTDGTTSCVERGDGKTCDPCPCDDGYVCNPTINQCRKLCHTDGATNDCGDGTCQGGTANYPSGIGVCVGGEAACD